MADELKVTAALDFTKSGVTQTYRITELSRDVATARARRDVQTIGTSAETVAISGDIGNGGYIMIKNLDATNFVTLQAGAGGDPMVKLLAGDVALFRTHPSYTLYATADTASCDIELMCVAL